MTGVLPFERLVAGPCPPPGELLLALAAEFRHVDLDEASFRLDDLARGLFAEAAAGDPHTIAVRLATLLTRDHGFRTDGRAAGGLLLDAVLDRRAGHPLALAALAAEVARRAGVAIGICSTPGGWYAALGAHERLWLVDATTDGGPAPTGPIRRHCGHEVAWAALTGLYARFVRDGDVALAARAGDLRARLPVARHA